MKLIKYFVSGGAGFIGSSLINRLLKTQQDIEVVCYDNLSTGKLEYLDGVKNDPRFKIIIGDLKDLDLLILSMHEDIDIVYHFASNADISKAMIKPTIDFYEGTLLTQNILEAARINKVKKIIYASGSGIFGEPKGRTVDEDFRPMIPTSTYGASKMAGEALISAYCNMFNIIGRVYRFANVVGRNQTHGVSFDFINKLKKDSTQLTILGNGQQFKGYIHVSDVINGILVTESRCKYPYEYFNIAPEDQITVNEIADIVVKEMGLKEVKYNYTGDLSWKGDIPVIKMSCKKIKKYGWKCNYTSKEAIQKSVREMLGE